VFNRERRNPSKLLGIAFSFAAIAALGAGPENSTSDTQERKLALPLVVALVIIPVVLWGLSDYFASQVARHLDMFSVRHGGVLCELGDSRDGAHTARCLT
jgi:drug/metabolite transporter (DMT)-like permease